MTTKTFVPKMVHLCNKAVDRYQQTKDSQDPAICQIEDELNSLAASPANRTLTETLTINKRLTKAHSGRFFVRLDAAV